MNGNFVQLNSGIRIGISSPQPLVIATFTVSISSFSPSHIGRYVYAYPPLSLDNGFIINAIETNYCNISYQYGLVWPGLFNGEYWTQNCSSLGGFFSNDGRISLGCNLQLGYSIQSECSLLNNNFPVIEIILLPNLNFGLHSIGDIISRLASLTLISSAQFESNFVFNTVLEIEFTHLSIQMPNSFWENFSDTMLQIENYFLSNMEVLTYTLVAIQALKPSTTCYCDFVITDDFPPEENIFEICEYW